jgi:ribosomal protein S18 acetylase RimI-like enzyme
MEILAAEMGDIEAIVEIGKRGHAASANARYEFDEMKTKILCATLIAGKKTCLFVAKDAGKIVGILLGQEDTYGYCKLRYATDIACYSETPGAGRALMRRFEKWAFEERRVDMMCLGVSHGGRSERSTIALYKRAGYEHMGGIFTKHRT